MENEAEVVIERTEIKSYKIVCIKLGVVMCIYFICRLLSGAMMGLVVKLAGSEGYLAFFLSNTILILMVYILPMLAAAFAFGSFKLYKGNLRTLYKKPRRLARALGTFPAMYGLGLGIALITLLISMLISRLTGGQTFIEDILRPTAIEPPTTLASALMLVFMLVVIAPVFEEIWVRGIFYDALSPYGHGIAIIISSIIFGLMHGSMQMLFYTTALGFALGYVRYATGSLFVVTVLHAMINAVAAGLLFLSALSDIADGMNRLVNTILSVYTLAWFILVAVGVIAFIMKIPTIKKYRIENSWTEITSGKKMILFFTSIPVILMLILAVNEHVNNMLLGLLI